MAQVKFGRTRFGEFMRRQGVYVALGICLIAAGLGIYAATNGNGGSDIGDPMQVGKTESNIPVSSEVKKPTGSTASQKPQSSSSESSSGGSSLTSSQPAAPFWVMPLSGTVTKSFDADSLQYSETYKDWRLHAATDIKATAGAPVFAAGKGTVTEVFYDAEYGQCVRIDHGDGVVATYCGLNREPVVKVGDKVQGGDQIGALDTVPCESVEPAHLHLIFTVDSKPADPLKVMGFLDTDR